MSKTTRRLAISLVTALAALLTVGVAAASAHGGRGGGGFGAGSVSSVVTQAATQLNVPRATLVTAIQNSAATHIAGAKSSGDITASQAANLTTDAQDNLNVAYRLSETATVASNLSITADALDTAFSAARKAVALAQVDAALADGRITSDQATTLKTTINGKTFPGYKSGLGGLGGHHGRGLGLGAGSSSGTTGSFRHGGFGNGARHGFRG